MGGSQVGLGGSSMRIEAAALRHVLNETRWDSGATFAVERRTARGRLRIGVFGDIRSAAEAIDEAVGMGEGTERDYEIEVIPAGFGARHRWVRPVVLALIALAIVFFLVFVFWPR